MIMTVVERAMIRGINDSTKVTNALVSPVAKKLGEVFFDIYVPELPPIIRVLLNGTEWYQKQVVRINRHAFYQQSLSA